MKTAHRLLLAAPLALAMTAVTLAESGTPGGTATVTTESPAHSQGSSVSDSNPQVTINGQPVVVGTNGVSHLTLPTGDTQIEVSGGGNTTVTASNSGDGSGQTTGTNSNNVMVDVDSDSSQGDSWSSTHVYGFNSSDNGSSSSFSSTHVFSTGSNHVHVSTP